MFTLGYCKGSYSALLAAGINYLCSYHHNFTMPLITNHRGDPNVQEYAAISPKSHSHLRQRRDEYYRPPGAGSPGLACPAEKKIP